MSRKRVEASHFSPDTQEFIRFLSHFEVRYLIVGGEAVILYGHARLTGDVDFFYDRHPENADRLYTLVINKEAVGRPKDLTDLKFLGKLRL